VTDDHSGTFSDWRHLRCRYPRWHRRPPDLALADANFARPTSDLAAQSHDAAAFQMPG